MSVPTFTPLEYRILAGACETVAAKERERAAACASTHPRNSRNFIMSAESYDQLAVRCNEDGEAP